MNVDSDRRDVFDKIEVFVERELAILRVESMVIRWSFSGVG